MTCRMWLGSFGLTLGLSVAGVAGAQPPPAAAGEEGPGDAVEEEKEWSDELPPRVPWRGTTLKWGNNVTTSALGIGQDYQSDSHEVYSMDFALTLNYFVVDQDDVKVSVALVPAFSTELTNSGWTTTEREPQFSDLPLSGTVSGSLYSDPEYMLSTSASGSFAMIFPTSPSSSAMGTYLTTSPRVGISQSFPLAGKDAPTFKTFALSLGGRWDHRFGDSTTAVNEDLDRPRQTSGGVTYLSDQLTFNAIASDTLQETISLGFPIDFGDTNASAVLAGAFFFNQQFLPEFEGAECEVMLATGCVKAGAQEDVNTTRNLYGFTVVLGIFPMPEFGVSLAYANASNQLGSDGQRRSIFYSPNAAFAANLMISIDAIYEAAIGPRRNTPAMSASRKRKEKRSSAMSWFF